MASELTNVGNKAIQDTQSYTTWMLGQEYDSFRKIMFNTTLSFKVMGHLSRDAGQFVSINVVNSEELAALFGKLWQIYGITHVWQGNSYVNEIQCFRTVKLASDSLKKLNYHTLTPVAEKLNAKMEKTQTKK